MQRAYIAGVSGTVLTKQERALFSHRPPCGLILFARNCVTFDQVRELVRDAIDAAGHDLLVLIDQEGGRVQRLRPPLAKALPPARVFSELYDHDSERGEEAAFEIARLAAHDLKVFGINTNCAPVLDVPVSGADPIIGDRALGSEPKKIARLGRAVANGLLAGGVVPVIKHIPGHGRANADSHRALPTVTTDEATLRATDFAPFKTLSDLPLGMTAHVVFSAVDQNAPASTSALVTRDVIRGWIGYDGLLMSDDVSMKALSGPMAARAEAVLRAGSDVVLHCNGDLDELRAVAQIAPELSGDGLRRYRHAHAMIGRAEPFDRAKAESLLSELMARAGAASESV